MKTMTIRRFAVLALLITLLVAGVLSFYASRSPDGLQHVAETKGFSQTETEHHAAGSPLAGYEAKGITNKRLSGGLAGVIGVGATGLLMGGIILVLRRRHATTPAEPQDVSH